MFLIGLPWRPPLCAVLRNVSAGHLCVKGTSQLLLLIILWRKEERDPNSTWFHNLGQLSRVGLLLFQFPPTHYQEEPVKS
jgi:hypothetical protein